MFFIVVNCFPYISFPMHSYISPKKKMKQEQKNTINPNKCKHTMIEMDTEEEISE